MALNTLPKTTQKGKRRLGLGHGSGRSKTSGRGTKGQKARNKVPFTRYSGGSLSFVKRLPFLRGKDKNNSFGRTPVILNVEDLNVLSQGTVVDIKALSVAHLVKEKEAKRDGVKILGDGSLTVALTVTLPVSRVAQEKIEKAGGKVEVS
jgi:large subunit ribosomal protein L15